METKLEKITNNGITVIDKQNTRSEIIGDTVVISLGYRARGDVADKFRNLAREVYIVGDCVSPRNLISAIHEAFNVAVEI